MARYGAGGGVVWDSKPEEEHAELISKTQILNQATAWGGIRAVQEGSWRGFPRPDLEHLEQHLQRMAASARRFGLVFDRTQALEAIAVAVGRVDRLASASPVFDCV